MLFKGRGAIKINKQLSETIPSVKCVVAIKNYQISVDNARLVTYEVIKTLCTVNNTSDSRNVFCQQLTIFSFYFVAEKNEEKNVHVASF